MTRLRRECVTSRASLASLADDWQTLWSRAECRTAFDHPAWLIPWWRHFDDGELRALALYRGDELVGFAPFYIRTLPGAPRDLALLGAGNSDYVNVLAAPGYATTVADESRRFALDLRSEWDRASVGPLPQDSPLAGTMAHGSVCSRIDVSAGVECAIPKGVLRDVRYARRRLTRDHAISFESATPEQARGFLDDLAHLHTLRWNAREQPGVLADARTYAFHDEALPGLIAAHVGAGHRLRVDGEAVAALYALRCGATVCYYIFGFDPAWHQPSVGSLLMFCVMEQAAAEGVTTIDLLSGREPYKARWGARQFACAAWDPSVSDATSNPSGLPCDPCSCDASGSRADRPQDHEAHQTASR